MILRCALWMGFEANETPVKNGRPSLRGTLGCMWLVLSVAKQAPSLDASRLLSHYYLQQFHSTYRFNCTTAFTHFSHSTMPLRKHFGSARFASFVSYPKS